MLLRNAYSITSNNTTTQNWLRRKGLIGNFTDEDSEKCRQGRLRHARDTSYKSDGHCWRCKGKVSIRQGSWFDHSKLTLEQIIEIYFWFKELPNKLTEEECVISNKSVVDWYNFCREVCATIIEEELTQIGGVREVIEIDESKLLSESTTRGGGLMGCGFLVGLIDGCGKLFSVNFFN
uniref:Uncharacterized protein n=1 Tax=Amphimedon queenslandica TaxID=400682 RepID=A0A1X7VK15_AMPQE